MITTSKPDIKQTVLDPAHNVFFGSDNPLDKIFKPKTVAVIGASEKEGSVG